MIHRRAFAVVAVVGRGGRGRDDRRCRPRPVVGGGRRGLGRRRRCRDLRARGDENGEIALFARRWGDSMGGGGRGRGEREKSEMSEIPLLGEGSGVCASFCPSIRSKAGRMRGREMRGGMRGGDPARLSRGGRNSPMSFTGLAAASSSAAVVVSRFIISSSFVLEQMLMTLTTAAWEVLSEERPPGGSCCCCCFGCEL